MIIPANCPSCKRPLLNKFLFSTIEKECIQINHYFKCISRGDIPIIIEIEIDVKSRTRLRWNYPLNIISIYKFTEIHKLDESGIPWFEPDLSDYPRLLRKLRKYVLFR